jgi:hypothetical protein
MNLYIYRKIVYIILGILFTITTGIIIYKMIRANKVQSSISSETDDTVPVSTEQSVYPTISNDPSSQYRELMDSVSLDSLSEQSLEDEDFLSMLDSGDLP